MSAGNPYYVYWLIKYKRSQISPFEMDPAGQYSMQITSINTTVES